MTIGQLIALNDEMAALIRAGVPLERGLVEAGRDLQGQLGGIMGDLGERLARGERLPEALVGSKKRIPALYRAVVEAGIRSGRLSEALEGMANLARHYAEMRRTIGLALIYPLFVFELAYVLALIFLFQIAPRFIKTFEVLGLAPIKLLNGLVGLGDSVLFWGPIPAVLLVVLGFVWLRTGQSSSLDSGTLRPILRRLPVIGPMIRSFLAANYADLLALLIDHQVPLDQAVILAGEASGDRDFLASSKAVATSIQAGREGSSLTATELAAFPPLLAWIFSNGRGRGNLSSALHHLAWTYRRRAETRGEFLRSALPTILLLAIGVSAVIVYCLLLFIPLLQLWEELAIPVNH